MKNTVKLNTGYSVDITETTPDKKGNKFVGYLIYRNKIVNLKKISHKKYPNVEVLVLDYLTKVLPKYIRENKVNSIKGISTNAQIFNFVKEYILSNKITWGTTLNVLDILDNCGYRMPSFDDRDFKFTDYNEYLNTVTKISLVIVKQLNSFGFTADRSNSDVSHHKAGDKHSACMNIVYTRYPWSRGHKACKTIKSLQATMRRSLLSGVDITKLIEVEPDIAKQFKVVAKVMASDSIEFDKIISKGFDLAYLDFDSLVADKQYELVSNFSKWCPVNYGVYK